MSELVKDDLLVSSTALREEKKAIAIGAMVQALFTFCSRIFGMIRDVLISHVFGAGAITDSFFIAFTIPNVLRQFFAEGAFSVAFVPIYVDTRENGGSDEAKAFYQGAFGFLLIALSLVTIFGVIFSKKLVYLFALGFADNAVQSHLTDVMTKILFPYIFLVSLVALFGARLACYRKFAAMAAAPVFLNLSMIFAISVWADFFPVPIYALSFSVILGGIIQVMLMVAVLVRENLWAWPTFFVRSRALQKLFRVLGPGLFGVFVYQLNIIVLRQLASFLGEGQISYYYNADRITQFATGIFAVSIATAALPELSRSVARFGQNNLLSTLQFTISLTSFVITPSAFGLMVFAHPIVSVLFVHGAFTSSDAAITANTLVAFSPSLIAFGLSRPLIQTFYAVQDTRTPVLVGAITVIINLVLGLAMVRYEVVGLAMTLSISSVVQFLVLYYLLKEKMNGLAIRLWQPFLAHLGISAVACGVGLWVARVGDWSLGFDLRNALALMALTISSSLTYFALAYYFKLPESIRIIDGIRSRLFR